MAVGFTTTYNGRVAEVDDLLVKREFFNDGNAWAFGFNDSSMFAEATGASASHSSPKSYGSGTAVNWKQMDTGRRHTVGIKSDGTLWSCGYGWTGGLGDNTSGNIKSSPVTTAGGGTNWKQASGGQDYSCAVKTDGTLWTWGSNIFGMLGDGSTTNRSSPVTTAGGGTNWVQVSAGTYHTAAVKTDGTLWTWGNNGSGRLGTNNTTSRSSPGTTSGGGTNWKEVSCGQESTGAIKTDGSLWTWGSNGNGRLGDGTTDSRSSPGTTSGGGTNWKQVSISVASAAAVKTDGTLWTWGINTTGALGDGTTTNRSSPGTTSGGGTNWKQVSTSQNFMAAIKTDGTLWTWGTNAWYTLGDGLVNSRSSPNTVSGGGTNWKSVSCGFPTDTSTQNGSMALTDLTI